MIKKWNEEKLGNIAIIKYGYTAKAAQDPVGPKFLRITDLKPNGVVWDTVPFCKITNADYEKYCLRTGDIVFARTGATTGKSFLVKEPPDAVCASYLIKLSLEEQIVLPEFLILFFQTNQYWEKIEVGISGSAQGGFNATKLANFIVPIPSLPEQQRIVSILDEVFEGISKATANVEKNIANARELFESYLNRVFEKKGDCWIKKRLGELCSIKHGFAFKSRYFVSQGDYVLLTPGSFYENGGFRDQKQKTKYYVGEIPDGYILSKDDFLIAMTEQAVGLLGSSLIVPKENRFLHNQRLGLVKKYGGVDWHNDFFHHLFNTKYFRNEVQMTASGVKVRHTSPKKLEAIPISFPSDLTEQQRVAKALNEIKQQTQNLETVYRQKLAALEELKQSILQKAFSGELTSDRVEKQMETA